MTVPAQARDGTHPHVIHARLVPIRDHHTRRPAGPATPTRKSATSEACRIPPSLRTLRTHRAIPSPASPVMPPPSSSTLEAHPPPQSQLLAAIAPCPRGSFRLSADAPQALEGLRQPQPCPVGWGGGEHEVQHRLLAEPHPHVARIVHPGGDTSHHRRKSLQRIKAALVRGRDVEAYPCVR
jgi:hypothetical protein